MKYRPPLPGPLYFQPVCFYRRIQYFTFKDFKTSTSFFKRFLQKIMWQPSLTLERLFSNTILLLLPASFVWRTWASFWGYPPSPLPPNPMLRFSVLLFSSGATHVPFPRIWGAVKVIRFGEKVWKFFCKF